MYKVGIKTKYSKYRIEARQDVNRNSQQSSLEQALLKALHAERVVLAPILKLVVHLKPSTHTMREKRRHMLLESGRPIVASLLRSTHAAKRYTAVTTREKLVEP